MAVAQITFKFEGLDELCKAAQGLGKAGTYAMYRATDEVGNKLFTQMKRAVATQAGVPYARAGRVMSRAQAMGSGRGSFVIIARDVTMSLKEFNPRQTMKGVTAAPWGHRHVFPHTFFGPGGHVYKNVHTYNKYSNRNNAIEKMWGPNIPKEMVKDKSEAVFYAYTAQALPAAIEKWILRFIP